MKPLTAALTISLIFLLTSCTVKEKVISSLPPNRLENITDAHLHVQSVRQAPSLIKAMDASGIFRTVIVGSPDATIYRSRNGYKGYRRNNEQVLEIARKYPGRFIPLTAVDPQEEYRLELLKGYVRRGARGIKLYSGHSSFYNSELDAPDMYEVYGYAQEKGLPIVFHVNSGRLRYLREFEQVLKDFPRMTVICPHFCLSSIKLSRLERLLNKYPNLYTDISFGDYLAAGLRRISRRPQKYREFMSRYRDRILFATDIVATDNPAKDVRYLSATQLAYRSMLEKEVYFYPYLPGEKLRGLVLKEEVLKKIYVENASKLFGPPDNINRPSGKTVRGFSENRWGGVGLIKWRKERGHGL